MNNPDIKLALELFYKKKEIGTADIEELFNVKTTKATSMKKKVKEIMAEKGVKSWIPYSINTKIAFEHWGIDIEEMKKSLKELRKLGLES